MTIQRTLLGGAVSVIIGLLWHTLGTGTVVAAVILGLLGFGIGWIAEAFHRLERDQKREHVLMLSS